MTLYKQIMLAMSMLVLLLLATAMLVNYKNAEGFVKDQLLSNAQNTASSLGVAIGHVNGDKAMEETLINAVYDSGYYESIVLTDIDGNVSYERRDPVRIQDVPSWFVKHVELDNAEADVPLSSNWRLVGHLKIKGHRGHAYEQLWNAFKEMFIGFIVLGVLAVIGVYIFLLIVLKPLKRVREQAEAVMQRRFIFQEPLPKTKEMRDVVSAMNLLVRKVKRVYEKEAKAIADYKRVLYEDRETGYYNRSYFTTKLQDFLHASDDFSYGYLVAFGIHDYPKLLEEQGSSGVHKAVITLRDAIDTHCCDSFREAVICRTRESDIMVILPSSRKEDVEAFTRAVCKTCIVSFRVDCAYISYKERELLAEILKRVDNALMVAAASESSTMQFYADTRDDIPIFSHSEWVKKIHESMHSHAFIPMLQAVMDEHGKTVQEELLLRLKYEGKIVSAGLFMPIIAGVKMLPMLDRYVLEQLDSIQLSRPVAINITHDFITQSANLHVISSLTQRWKSRGIDITFELPNTTVASDPEATKAFAAHIQQEGWQIGIDHFTVAMYDLQLLEELKPAYLKINAAYLLSLIEVKEKELTSSSLFTLAELLDIDLIATVVDSEETAVRLKNNGITYMQGFWVSEPREGSRI